MELAMIKTDEFKKQYVNPRQLPVTLISLVVSAYGIYILADTLLRQVFLRHSVFINNLDVDLTLLIGLTVIYLGTMLIRQKHNAWVVTIGAYSLYAFIGVIQLLSHIGIDRGITFIVIRSIILPCLILALLIKYQDEFFVKSDIQGFHSALRFVVIILMVTLLYGVAGFELLDNSDFHQEISWPTAIHYTVDQFNITTDKPIHPYTRRAKLFVDSLSFVSTISVLYALVALFQPLKARFSDQNAARAHVKDILDWYGGESEEFFKLWPHDKQYFIESTGEAALAFYVYRGVALCIGDPVGNTNRFDQMLNDFCQMCFHNDWLPAMVHVSQRNNRYFENAGFNMQKLGQEAVVNIDYFNSEVSNNKYFRQIRNRFAKQEYTFELLEPPHHRAVIDRLKSISDEWLGKGGRSERGLTMGYFTEQYIQMCQVGVARDAAGTIQAFTNLVPADFNKQDATYDMLRQSDKSLSNINDYLLLNLLDELKLRGYETLNLGLCPLAGFENEDSERKSLIDNVLKFAYANGDKFFSFSGLYRFKAKYEPDWQDKYLGYKSGIRGFSRTVTALTRSMSKVVKK